MLMLVLAAAIGLGRLAGLDRALLLVAAAVYLAGVQLPTMTIAAGDRMAQAFTLTGTHEGEFLGIPATRKKIRVNGIVMSRFEDGKIVEEWKVIDQLAFLQQLGVES